MADLSTKTLGELRELYPTLKATSKKVMLEKIAALQEVVEPEVVTDEVVQTPEEEIVEPNKSPEFTLEDEEYTWYNIFGYLKAISKTKTKVLIECPTTIEADFIWNRMSTELFEQLQKEGITIMGSSTRRDAHFNGTCYVRFVCHTNFEHLKRIFKYDTFKKLV